jgi:8-oxo-dGTP pyrophosphatase MutT (NUDIX family)
VVWRMGAEGIEVVVVHRPAYDDWSLPKGKANPGEPDEETALREVEEETGLRCRMETELPSSTYHDRHGRPKVVRWWTMHPVGGLLRPAHEVDDVRWVGLDEAARIVIDRDRLLLDALAELVRAST